MLDPFIPQPTYETGIFTTTFTFNGTGSPGTTGAIPIGWTRTGNVVTLDLRQTQTTTGSSSSILSSNSILPSNLWPVRNCYSAIRIRDTAVIDSPGILVINSTGVLQIWKNSSTTAFTDTTANVGSVGDNCATYYIGS